MAYGLPPSCLVRHIGVRLVIRYAPSLARMGSVFVAGDWHGNVRWATSRLQSIGMIYGPSMLLHAGDFGIWPGDSGKRYLDSIEKVCAKYDIAICVTPGNHEDWSQITAMWEARESMIRPHIRVLPHGLRFELEGVRFLSLGGATSMDRQMRTEGVNWWPEEDITYAHVETALVGGPVDVMITHESPDAPWQTPAVERICSAPGGWPLSALMRAQTNRKWVSQVFEAVTPRLLIHGHYHVSDETAVWLPGQQQRTDVYSLPGDDHPVNTVRLDLESLRLHTL